MKTPVHILLAAVFCVAARVSGESTWTYVPSSPDARSLGTLAVSQPLNEAVVRLIGANPATRGPVLEALRVYSIEMPNSDKFRDTEHPPKEPSASPIPEGARWPDSSGRIMAALQEPAGRASESAIRNPWEVRILAKLASTETVFACGGVVLGGSEGPIAIVNGHLVKRGDALGVFRVASILSNVVLLARGALVFVLPLGRSTTISTITDG